MNKPTIIFYNLKSLFEVFDELKEKLKFEMLFFSTKKDLISFIDGDIKNYIIISDRNLETNVQLNKIIINKYPEKVEKILEKINILLLKKKYLEQSDYLIKDYKLNVNSRILTKETMKLKLTLKEVQVILHLKDPQKKNSIFNLQKEVWGHNSELETHTVETHVYRLRKKIKNKFNDGSFIISTDDGYKI